MLPNRPTTQPPTRPTTSASRPERRRRMPAAAVRDAAGRVSEAAADLGDKVYQRGRQAGEQVTKHVEAQPLSSVLVAGAVGFVVGMLMARR